MGELDPNIILGIRPPPSLLDIQDARLKRALTQQQMAVTSQELQQRGQALSDQQQIKSILSQNGGDIEKALPQITTINPELGLRFTSALNEGKAKGLEFQNLKLAHDKSLLEWIGQNVQGAKTQADWDQLHVKFKAAGVDPSDLGDTYDPATQQRLIAQGQSIQGAVDAENKRAERSLEAAKLAETTRHNLADEAKAQTTGPEEDARFEKILAAQSQKQPVAPADLAWANAYRQRKLIGPEATAAAAADRQAATIAQQTAQQGRAQSFTEAEKGRDTLTNKITLPYLDAKEKADTLRNVVAAAKGGNMEAANVQSLLGVLGLVTSEGVKRINNVELEQVTGAGSLLERIKGQAGKIISGQPLPGKLQQDLTDLAGLLEQSARKKYEQGFRAVTRTYPALKDAEMEPAAAAAAPAAGVTVTAPNGKTYPFADQAAADKFVADAKAKGLWK